MNETELCQDIDSGYLNGPDSSSELTSETELFTGKSFCLCLDTLTESSAVFKVEPLIP